MLEIRTTREGTLRVAVHVQPRAARSAVVGVHGHALKVRLEAPPVEGAANRELCEVLAAWLGCADREVSVVSGTTSRQKVVEVPASSRATLESLAVV